MKLFVLTLALCLVVVPRYASSETNGEPSSDAAALDSPSVEYLPPADSVEPAATKIADDGYRYRTVRRLRYRHRREVSQEYLPPAAEPTVEYLPPAAEEPETKTADDGYRYKTVRRLRFRSRHRRDVSEVEQPSNEYLPPVDVELAPDLKTVVGEDGYRYKTVRRLKYRRHRREADGGEEAGADASAVPANEYLPPAAKAAEAPAPAVAAAADDTVEVKSAELGKDGYRYKTVRRIRYRYRH